MARFTVRSWRVLLFVGGLVVLAVGFTILLVTHHESVEEKLQACARYASGSEQYMMCVDRAEDPN